MLGKHMVKPHATTATALAPRTIENGVMRGAGRAALERTPSFSELIAPVFRIKSLLDVQKNILRNGFIFVIILIRFFLKSLRLVLSFELRTTYKQNTKSSYTDAASLWGSGS